ncbi:Ldh family oxidoreductase [Paralcaligenes sp. KSB-10]|uniref:Ldh family oxidoreductase n=1 Tax=Paralcaligenes sp. KSB-10 TaxID=2901142 RepID=UPI001E624B8B|nr:Ldh family oxidoreductase [Paralcaligenes sp. KSB-10]UHL64440.1 Ldh family oxidoreductase [Paralcaligenes sp. KSB-10]
MAEQQPRYFQADALTALATGLFTAAGLASPRAACVARLLVLTDMMGRTTHGLAQCKPYLDQLEQGGMSASGDYTVVKDTGPTVVWDGNYLPGLWLVETALQTGFERLPQHGVVTFSIRRSHHIGCLAALVKQATDRGYYAMLLSSGPHGKYVAPYGGTVPLFSPNPIAIGYPTAQSPVLVDTCASITTVSMTREKAQAGGLFEQAWLLDPQGKPTHDPRYLEQTTPRGSLMLLGGVEAGHKGFGLALMVEALTQGLSGFGRKDAPERWGASVYLQLIDPDAFAGRESFVEQMEFLAQECRANPPIDPDQPVRLPGEKADRNIAHARKHGVPVSPSTLQALRDYAARLKVDDEILAPS